MTCRSKIERQRNLREFFKKWLGVDAWVSERARVGFGFAALWVSGHGAVSAIIVDRGRAWFGSA